ncbi:hypothetical protein HPB50_000486 [Hyalomma asiaticum]|uniref:Uncharacterized protein n=1 Tax=Hyalomma asiaticum TaxID=266040 RepID=A0ACB7RPI7_HYAAI|nr:hypothetical protein HPB50_000486 [Hyalomma asiaticum]
MDKQDVFGLLRTDIGEEERLAEQMRMEAEALGLHPLQEEGSGKVGGADVASAKTETPTKSSRIAESTVSAGTKPSSPKSSLSAKSSLQASAKESKAQTTITEKPEEYIREQQETEAAPTEGTERQKPEHGAAAAGVDLFPEEKPEPLKEEADQEDSQRMLVAALAVLGLLALLVLAGLFLYTKPLDVFTNGSILNTINPCSSPGCIRAKEESDTMRIANIKLESNTLPCDNFYQHTGISFRKTLNDALILKMNGTLSTISLDASTTEPYRNLILYYRSCIEFHSTPMPTDVRVRKALYLLDLSFTEWLDHNTDPMFLFYFIIRLSLSQGVNTLLSLSVIEKNRDARVVLEVGMPIRKKFYATTSRIYEERKWRLYMSDVLFSLGIPNITAEVAQATLQWDFAQERKWTQAQADNIHEHTVYELIQRESVVSGEDWMYAINDNLPYNLRLKNSSNMDTHNLTLIDAIVVEFFNKSKIELVTYVVTLAIAELLVFDFNRGSQQEKRTQADAETCLRSSYINFPDPTTSLFVREHVKKSILDNFHIFFENIKKEVLDSVSTFDWMDQNTRVKARVKVSTVGLRTVQSTTREQSPDEERMSGDFMANYVAVARYNKRRANRYPEPSQKLQQSLNLIVGDLLVDYEQNVISVPARDLLEPVTFEDVKEKFVNLSYIGSSVAAEIVSVAFSPSGSKYAAGGLQIDWWPERVNTSYDKRLHCYVEEYLQLAKDFVTAGNYSASATPPAEVLEYLMTYSRGLEIAYKMADIGDSKENKQLFFVRFCQPLCHSDGNKNTFARPSLNVKLACMFPMLHSEGFQAAFDCGTNQQLYPKQSCPRL